MIKSHILEQNKEAPEKVRENFEKALLVPSLRKNPKLWICASDFEVKIKAFTKARTLLQKAKLKITSQELAPEIWFESIQLEIISENTKIAQSLCSQALQKFPLSGKIWALQISLEPIASRKSKASDALKKIEDSPWIFLEVAKLFWQEKKIEKARKFLR